MVVPPTAHPRHAAKRARRKQARPSELLDAALDLFVEKGFAATRVEAVAARAGVSKGTLFLYFPSKEALFRAVVHEHLVARFADWGGVDSADAQGSSADMLRQALHSWWGRLEATRLTGLSKLVLSEARNFPELAACYQAEVVRPAHAWLRRIIERGIARGEFRPVDADDAVRSVAGSFVYLVMHRYALDLVDGAPDPLMPERYIAAQLDILLHGLLRPPPGGPSRIPALS